MVLQAATASERGPAGCPAASRACPLRRTSLIAFGASLVVAAGAVLATSAPVGSAADDTSEMRVNQIPSTTPDDVSLVVNPPRELSLLDLGPDDITVIHGDSPVPAEVTTLAGADLDVAIVVDFGGSDPEARAALGAADELVRTLPAGARMTLITATDGPAVEVTLTDDQPSMLEALSRLTPAPPGPLVDAVGEGIAQLESGTGSRSTIIAISPKLVSDAAGLRATFGDIENPPALYLAATGSDPGSDPADLRRTVEATGGRAVVVERTGLLIAATDQISSELGSQYRIDFRAPADDPAEVTVRVARDGVEAETPIALTGLGEDGDGTPPPADEDRDAEAAAPATRLPDADETDSRWLLTFGVIAALAAFSLLVVGAGGITLRRSSRRATTPELLPGGVAAAIRPPAALPPPSRPAPDQRSVPELADRPEPPSSPVVPAPAPAPATVDLSDSRPRVAARTDLSPTVARGDHLGRAGETGPVDERAATIDLRAEPLTPLRPAPSDEAIDSDLLEAAGRADEALAELEALVGVHEEFPLDGLVLREAVASVNSDGSDVALWDIFRSRSGNARGVTALAPDVERLVEATIWGFEEASRGHLDRAVLTDVVDRRGIGDPRSDASPATRPHDPAALSAHTSSPSLRAALVRQILDTSWPDDTSRPWLGRTAVSLSLARDGVLSKPIVDVSTHTLVPAGRGPVVHRSEASLRDTVDALAACSAATQGRLEGLVQLRESYLESLAVGRPSRAPAVVDLLVANPVITAQFVADKVDVTHQGALNLIRRFEQTGWVRCIGSFGRGGRKYWIAPDVLAVFEGDFPGNRPFSSTERKEQP